MLKLFKNSGLKAIFIAFTGILLFSCQDEFLEIGSDLVDNVSYTSDSLTLPVTSYTQPFLMKLEYKPAAWDLAH